MKKRETRIFIADFETTVYADQTHTEVWAAAIVELYTEDVLIFQSMADFINHILTFDCSSIIYFHNLKFDGEFILNFLLNDNRFSQAFEKIDGINDGDFKKKQLLKSYEYIYSISAKGMWYSITIKSGKNYIEIRDSLKLIPCTVKRMGDSFKTKHRKSSIEYKGYRFAGCEITEEERKYIANDVLVVKEVLEIMYKQGHTSLTIGSCCLKEYKQTLDTTAPKYFDKYRPVFGIDFPNLYLIEISDEALGIYDFGSKNVGEYVRKSYRGGWCYVVDAKRRKMFHNGTTADVNSLYPSMMHSESGNKYPIGKPQFWIGNYIPDEALDDNHYYFIRIRTQFKIRPNHLPCIQVKGSPYYRPNEWLKTSDILSKVDGEYHSTVENLDGEIENASVTLTLTETDFNLIREQYYLYNCEILDGCYFKAVSGIFDEYIEHYRDIKISSEGAVREIAKLFLNNLYGKMATSTDSSFKYAFLKDDKSTGYNTIIKNDKTPGYIPVGSAITSYARNFTIRAAQMNYNGVRNRGFIYADTDSIHCDLKPEELKGIKVDNAAFCCWKLESCWDDAVFIRQKTYAEHITHENLIPVQELKKPKDPYWEIKCAGMPDPCKNLFLLSLNPFTKDIVNSEWFDLIDDEYKTAEAVAFLSTTRTINDFNYGLEIPGKLMPKHINGGVVLEDIVYTMKERSFLI